MLSEPDTMARTSNLEQLSISPDAIDLRRALIRLEQKILISPPQRLLRSSFERTKTAANLEYARTLLLRLEHSVSSVKIPQRKQALQNDLQQQRSLIKRLSERLHEIGQRDDGKSHVDASTAETILASYGLKPLQAQISPPTVPREPTKDISPPNPDSLETTNLTSTLRARKPETLLPSSATTAHSLSPSPPNPSDPSTGYTPSLPTASYLESADSMHAAITSEMVAHTAQMKQNARAMQALLEKDKEALSRTEDALGKNSDGMENATKRMGMLQKMGEGRWWWGRMVLYAIVMGLWLVALLVVFVMPKLRF